MALTGGLAIAAHLQAHERPTVPRPLNDLDFVIDNFATIPPSVTDDFLLNHVHPSRQTARRCCSSSMLIARFVSTCSVHTVARFGAADC